ncbi:MAG: alpha/beta hydrolase [Desulfobulbus sp.]|nr:MAG: alpha/beta hydrolase [Desulfobulbus sp.]
MTGLAQYPFTAKTFQLDSGNTLSYLDEGNGPVVVMVHGNPSWSYLYRNVVTSLRSDYRCIVPDHLGCGFSDKPQHYPYRLENHIANLSELLDHLHITKCTLIVHDWGGAIGMGWAGEHPERVAGLVVLNTAAFRSSRIPFRIAVCRWPLLGKVLVRGLNGFAWPATFMAVHKKMSEEVVKGFLQPYDSWKNRVAVHRFVLDIPLHPTHPSLQTLTGVEQSLKKLTEKPMLICWGGQDFCFNYHFYTQWQKRFPAAVSRYYPHAGHYVLEDAHDEIMSELLPFLESCDG